MPLDAASFLTCEELSPFGSHDYTSRVPKAPSLDGHCRTISNIDSGQLINVQTHNRTIAHHAFAVEVAGKRVGRSLSGADYAHR